MFAANKYNYSRYGLFYVRSMTWLRPEILDRFCQGQQSLHHTAGIYNGQWSDMFIETNWTKKGRGPGGIIGMTENPQTMASWVYSMDATMTLTSRRCLGMMQMYKLPTRRRLKVVSTEMGMIASHCVQLWSRAYPMEGRGSAVVSTSACHAGGPGSRPGPGTLLGVKTWLSTLEIVYLCVFRMRH